MEMGDEVKKMQRKKAGWIVRLILLVGLLWAAPGWGATYYASPTGSGTTCSLASPCAMNYAITTKAGSGDTVICATGTYGPYNQVTFAGVPKTVTTDGGIVSVSFNAGQHGYYLSAGASGSTINGISFTGVDAAKYAIYLTTASNNTISSCNFSTLTGIGIGNIAGTGNIIQRCTFRDIGQYSIYNETNASITVNSSLFIRCATGTGMDTINALSGSTAVVNNSNFIGGGYRALARGSGAGSSLTLNNCNFQAVGGVVKYPISAIVQANTATVTANNCAISSSMLKIGLETNGTVAKNNCIQNINPLFNNVGFGDGIVTFYAVDSNHLASGSLENYQVGADLAGVHISYFPDDTDQTAVTDYISVLQDFVIAGHDLGCEGKSSSRLDYDAPFKVSYSGGSANPRVVIAYTNPTTCTLSCVTDDATDIGPVTLSKSAQVYIGATVLQGGSIAKTINDHADWAVTMNDLAGTEYDDTYAYALEAGTIAISGATDIPFNESRFFNEEITLSKSDIESLISGYTVKSYFYPRYHSDANAKTAIKSAGYSVALSGQNTAYQLSSIDDIYSLSNDTLGSNVWWYSNAEGGAGYAALTDAQKESRLRAWARDLAVGVKFYGYWFSFCLPEASGLTSTEFYWIASELKANGIRILSFDEVQASLAGSHTPSGDGYIKTYVDNADFHILAGGPGIDNGTATGLGATFLDFDGIAETDGAGAALGAGVDIGAYTWAGHGANGPGSMGLGLGLH